VHFHSLVLDGVFSRSAPGAVPVFHPLPAPSNQEIAQILEPIHDRVTQLLRRRGRLPDEPDPTDPVAEQMPLLAGYAAASIQELIAAGPRAGHPVRRLRTAAAVVDTAQPRCARLAGFSLHANVALDARAREQLEHLCRYLLRPPLALDRLTESTHGQLLYELAHPRRDGATHLLLDPLELIEKLCVLIPPPRFHLLRFHGVLAPRARLRSEVVPSSRGAAEPRGGAPAPGPAVPDHGCPPSSAAKSFSWAALMKRVFEIDVLRCPCCGGRRRIVSLYPGGPRLRDLLDRLGVSHPPAASGVPGSPELHPRPG
jgi:putative transposase